MMTKKFISDLEFIFDHEKDTFSDKIKNDISQLICLVKKGNTIQDEFVLNLSKKMLDLLLQEKLSLSSKEVLRKTSLLIDSLDLKKTEINRNIKAIMLILEQDLSIREAAKSLKVLLQKVNELQNATPESYKLSRYYFEN